MDQVNYKGYARSIGFDPIKAPYQALDRMQERDSRIIRGMEENRRAIKEVRDQYGAGLERKFSLEMQDRDKQFQREQEYAANRQQAIERNAKTAIQNELQKGENATQTLESLSKFSKTISESLVAYGKFQEEQQQLADYIEAASGELPMYRQQAATSAEQLLNSSAEKTYQIVDGIQQRGADPYVVTNILNGVEKPRIGKLKAYAEMGAAEFPAWAQSRLDEIGASTASDRAAAFPQLFEEFLKMNQLWGLKADFMAPALMKMRQSYNTLIADARRSDIVSKSQMMRDDALENVFRSKSGETFVESFGALARSYDEDGRTPIGMTKARQLLYQELRDTTRYTDQDVEKILSEAMTDQGKSFKDRFGRDYDDLVKARRQDAQTEFGLSQAEEAQAQKEGEKQLLDWVKENWNGDEDSLKEIISQAKTKGIPTDRLQAYLAQSNEQRNVDFWNKEFEGLYDQGLLTLDDVDQPGIPMKARESWRQYAQQQEQLRSNAGIKQETVKGEFSDALKFKLVGESTTRTPHFSHRAATDYALRLFNQKFKQYSQTMEPSAAAEKARNDVLTSIEKGAGQFKVIQSGSAAGTQAFYAGFTPGKHSGAPQSTNFISVSQSLRKVRSNPEVINTTPLVSTAVLKDIDNRIKAGKPIAVPGLYAQLARATENMTPVDILNAQLKAAGLTSQVQPGFRNQLSQINDPRLQSILNQPLTQDRLNTAINGSGNAPATVRTGNAGYTDVVSLTSTAGFKFPQVAAAMWALESGWGKYHSGKNNVFNIKARPGQGTLKNGSYWRDYGSPLESAKDFLNLMTDPRYAPGLAAAKTPRQAIEAIAAGGYAGGEGAYPSKIIRVMQQMGVNVDQPYSPAPPSRNTAYMRPTLAYITGNIGPTSTGPHLDVKQMDNPNTPSSEHAKRFGVKDLDQYVVVDDPQYGRVPLSRVPVTDTFDGHLRRGSHGIDYGTASGSRLFIQNGARVVSKQRTQHGDKVVIQLPDGRRFSFLHGNSV